MGKIEKTKYLYSLRWPFALSLAMFLIWLITLPQKKELPVRLKPFLIGDLDQQEIFKDAELLALVVNNLRSNLAIGREMTVLSNSFGRMKQNGVIKYYTLGEWCLTLLHHLNYQLLPEPPSDNWRIKVSGFSVENKKNIKYGFEKNYAKSNSHIINTWLKLWRGYPLVAKHLEVD